MRSLLFFLGTASAVDHSVRVGPHEALPELDCAVRSLALNFSQVLTPWADPTLVYDALRLGIDCAQPPPAATPRASGMTTSAPLPSASACSFYADAVKGNDANDGSVGTPFATLGRALTATRAAPSPPCTITLRQGTFYLGSTVELGPADSGLTIAAYPGETPTLSGGTSLAGLKWSPVPRPSPAPPTPITGPFQGSIINLRSTGCVDAPGATNPGVCAPLGQFLTVSDCSAACVNSSACTGYTWHDQKCGEWANWCYARLDGDHALDGAADHFSGWKGSTPPTNLNVQTATLPSTVVAFDQLFYRGRRLMRARWPNANPETQQAPEGFSDGAQWQPPVTYPPGNETHVDGVRPYARDFPNFQWGFNGSVANFTTGSFWGTRGPPAGAHYTVPSGIVPGNSLPLGNWSRVRGAIVHGFQGGNWGDWHFNVSRLEEGKLVFDAGGWQEARGGGGNRFYIENIPELLDVPGEWYFDADTRELRVAFNGTAADGNETLVAAQLEELLRITGTSSSPVKDISLHGLTLQHTLTDYMLPFTVPSGGDWSFHDGGMVRMSGTEGVSISGCTFSAPGGNGLMISGYNRAAAIVSNEFSFTGSNAIVSAGLGGWRLDAGSPEYPEGTLVQGNVGREIGVYVKQSGFFYEGVSANFTILGNVVYNAARAAVNINDGFAGGHLLKKNLLFNTVRETNDHGAINSWDRQPYQWRGPQGGVDPLPILETRNFIINNYNGVWGLCHDDGSNSYIDTFNFLPWSGTKNYLGYNKTSIGNWFVYSDLSPSLVSSASPNTPPLKNGWNTCAMSYGTWPMGNLSDVWSNNTCITQGVGRAQFDLAGCNEKNPLDGSSPLFSGNTYANPAGGYLMNCGKSTSWNLSQAQALGIDLGSKIITLPSTEDIIAAGRALLQF